MTAERDDNLKIKRLTDIDKSKLPPDGGKDFNRLIFARSPYLLQHAENPVDWHQWGDEAFERAKKEDKPVFLSIGYATCHWCHVMEHESFEDSSVADVLNRSFVSIKVDREERPDVDDQYMTVAQSVLEGGGGWPLNVFLGHDRRPFFVSTYLPRTTYNGMPGIIEILEKVSDAWKNKRDVVNETCSTIINDLSSKAEPNPAPLPEAGVPLDATKNLESIYDKEWGGFGKFPKFPRPIFISFLLRNFKRSGDEQHLEMARHTLLMMRRGGIYDQIGFGFHRYAVDRKWLVPHFEKMLYDQGMLAILYLEAYQITGNRFFRDVSEEIFAFVLREMTSPEGGFYSAIDADSEGTEGNYYLWEPGEIRAILGDKDAEEVFALFNLTEEGNFERKNIPYLEKLPESIASEKGVPAEKLLSDIDKWLTKLLTAREKRIRPLRDEKILTSWNGLMIAAFAKGYGITGKGDYLEAADRALDFIKIRLTTPTGRLKRSYFAGDASVPGFLEDYMFVVWGLIELHEATLREKYLSYAIALIKESLRLFVDEASFGLYDTGNDAENVLIRKKSTVDGVIPSGNSVAAMNFLRLGKITKRQIFIKEGEGILRSLMGDLLAQPISYLHAVAALDYLRGTDVDITLVGDPDALETEEMLRSIKNRYIPGLVLRLKDENSDGGGYKTVNGRTAAYVCTTGLCRPPVAGKEALERILTEIDC
jgi:uncharacterized protein YyaL (SSP411 family)